MKQEINRLKVVLVEKKRTNRWLAAQLGKNEAIISKWCANKSQPNLNDLVSIARCLEVDTKDLLYSMYSSKTMPTPQISELEQSRDEA